MKIQKSKCKVFVWKLVKENTDVCSKTESLEQKLLTLEFHQRLNLLFSVLTESDHESDYNCYRKEMNIIIQIPTLTVKTMKKPMS